MAFNLIHGSIENTPDEISFWSYFVTYISDFKNIMNIIAGLGSSLIGALIGALLAIWVGMHLYKRKQRLENLGYLEYSVTNLVSIKGTLYNFKQQIITAMYAEACELENKISTKGNGEIIRIQHLWHTIATIIPNWPISIERLSFVTNRDPNIIMILNTTCTVLETLKGIVEVFNDHVREQRMSGAFADARQDGTSPQKLTSLQYQISLTKNLYDQTESTLYLIEKCEKILVRYGWQEFHNKMHIALESSELDEQLHPMRPPPMESWEAIDWLPRKKMHKRISRWMKYWWKHIRGKGVA